MSRSVSFLISALFLVAALSGCGSKDDASQTASRSPVTFLHYFTDSLSGGLDDMARTFNNAQAKHELKAISLDHEAFKTSIQDTLKSGNPPDLYSYWAGARTAAIVDDLEPLDELWRTAQLDEKFPASLTRAASVYNGKKYFVPLTQHYVGFFYNKRLFERHGVTAPKTWPEFLDVCATLKAKGVIPIALGARDKWPAQFWFDLLLLRTAPYTFRQDLMAGRASYTDAKVNAVFALWADLIAKGYFNSTPKPNELAWDSGANELVYNGLAAMTLMGSWEIGYFSNEQHKWRPGVDFDFFPFPVIDASLAKVALGPIDGLVMPRKAPNPEGARAAMAYLADVAAQQAISRGSGALAPNIQIPPEFYNDLQRRIRAEIEQSPYFAFNYDLATPPAVAELGLNAFSEFLAFPKAYPSILAQLQDEASARLRLAKP